MKKLFLLAALMLATLMLFAQPTGSKGGKFTVASGVQVRFSQGDLQFNVSQGSHQTADGMQPGTWRFAENQYDTIGASNKNISVENYTGWISLFGWGTSGYNGCSPMTYLKDATYGPGNVDIAGTNYDWGVYNAISNGGNKPGLWRTLTRNEWAYLLTNRANAEQLYSIAKINGLIGLMILPDGWTQPSGISFTPKMSTGQTTNIYTVEQWQTLENSGAIFIPKEGYRNYDESNRKVTYSTGNHYLAMSTTKTSTQRYVLSMGNSPYYNGSTFFRTGVPVRLARTVEEFTVTYKDWDGTTLKTENVEYGFAATPPTSPTREGYTFVSWQSNVSGMQTNYITGEVTFTAQYEKYITYTVTFVDGLTNDVISVLTKAKGATLATSEYPAVPSHEGNAFQGWFLTNGTAPISTSLTVNSNLTLTARFTWDATAGVLKGVMAPEGSKFSIRANQQVVFSQGNLQYQPSTNTWRFAADQYTVLTQAENKKFSDPTYTGWVDVFTWSAEGAEYGLTTSVGYPASIGTFVDWGQNPIANGGNKANSWRTLSKEEWEYIFSGRPNATQLMFTVYLTDRNSLWGKVILPDDWMDSPVCVSLLSDINYSGNNGLDDDDWSSFEAYGALFLPYTTLCALYEGDDYWLDDNFHYWTKSYNSEWTSILGGDIAYDVQTSNSTVLQVNSSRCNQKEAVRLARYDQDCPEIASEFSVEAIGCYTWEGKTYVSSGDYRHMYSTAEGCDSIVTLHLTIEQEQPVGGSGALQGLFSVSADTQVRFSRGNLQYQEDTHTWRFAPEQMDVIGPTAIAGGWRGAFGWSSTNSQFGLGTDFSGNFVDWGENAIANGGNRANRWRTLTGDEWYYLLQARPNAANLRYSGKIEGRFGTILLPDDWNAPAGVTLVKSQTNEFTRAQWTVLENAGAVFLPSGGLTVPSYWSASASNDTHAYDIDYNPNGSNAAYQRSNTYHVRLVQGPKSAIEGTLPGAFSVSETKQIQFSKGNLQYRASTGTWQFAASQTESIGEGNENISSTYNGWIDLFGFGTGNNPTLASTNDDDYGTFTDWGVNPIQNGGKQPNVWKCLKEHEWTYILNERPNAENLKGLATVNGAEGAILLPDDWSAPAGINFTPTQDNYTTNSYSASQWSQMEAAGAVFLVAAGMRNGTTYSAGNYSFDALYWSINTVGQLAGFGYRKGLITKGILSFKFQGCAVRLARDYVSDDECIPVYTSFTETACDSYTWNGVKYTVSGNYEQTFVTEQGCDSIVTLFLTINKSYNIGFGEEAEESYTWQGTTYTESGDYTKTLQSVNGCDSVVTLHLTIGEIVTPCTDKTSEFSASAETSYTWEGTTYTESGDYTKTLQTVAGCDSIVTLHLTIGSDDPEVPVQKWTNGVLPGKFSVSADKQVQFSQGNLQYKASENLWRFAPQQTDTIGSANSNISASYSGWIDLFGWGTGSNPTLATTNNTDYAVFTDWGVNAISNGGNEANLWRTLTAAEWEYLFRGRTNAEQLFSTGEVDGVFGCIILPDDWTAPEGITFNSIITSASWNEENGKYTDPGVCVLDYYNNFSVSEWKQMEEAGAVFLAAAGVRNGAKIEAKNKYGKYWDAPAGEETIAKSILIDICGFSVRFSEDSYWGSRSIGGSVRLVKEAESTCEPVEMNIAMQSCDLYRWNGVEYTQSGNYTQTFQAANGCDSIVNLALTITPSYMGIDVYAEAESSYTWEGTTYTESGDYEKWLYTDKYLCDSVVTLHLTITGGSVTPVGDQTWRGDDDDIKILGTITSTTTVRGLTFVATTDKPIVVDANTKSYGEGEDKLTFDGRIKLGGTGDANYRHLRFGVNGDCTIEIYGMSASGSNTRTLNVATGTFDNIITTIDMTGDVLNYAKYEYTGPATTFFLSSANSGFNIYAINLVHAGSTEGIDQITNNQSQITTKILLDGQVYILRGGKYYNILGVPANPLTH